MSGAEKYARWALDPANKIKTGRLIKLAAKRFLSDLDRDDIYFDEAEAVKMINFCEKNCNLWEGEWKGKPMHFEPWMRFIFEQVFGWFRKEDGLRRIQNIYVQIAKKNAKTTLLGMLNVFHVFKDDRVNTPSVFVGANNEDQAKLCVNITGQIIESSPRLAKFLNENRAAIYKYKGKASSIAHFERVGSIEPMSKETADKKSATAGGKQGVNASLVVIDEWGLAASANLAEALESSQASRREPLSAKITTSGFNLDGPCYSTTRTVSIEILEGLTQDDTFLPFIFELDPPLDDESKPLPITVEWLIQHPEVWQQCNPNLGVSVNKRFLEKQLNIAKNEGGTTSVGVLTLNFNVWCNSPSVWVPMEVWGQNSYGTQQDSLRGKICFGGLEIPHGPLGALLLIFPNVRQVNGMDIHALKLICWAPENKVTKMDFKSKEGNTTLIDLSAHKEALTICSGDVVENSAIYSLISDELLKYRVHSIAFTKSLETHDILQALVRDGYECNPISQGYSGISTPTIEWENLFTAKQMEHFNNPLLAWMNQQCEVVRNGSEIKLLKASGRNCGIHAGINALAQWMTVDALPDEDAGITEIAI